MYNFGSRLEIRVRNHTDKTVRCSGFVNFRTFNGSFVTHYYSDLIPAYLNSYRSIYPRSFNDRIMSAHHSIFCR